jgi:DNA-binding NarL/FixJ family response regulator
MENAHKILLIEDEEYLLENISEYLKLHHYHVDACKNANEALELLEISSYDLILSDIMMPEVSGTELLNILKQKNINNDIPFIFISAITDPKDIRISMGLGADDYITKPFKFEHLLLAIQSRLNRFKQIKNSSKMDVNTSVILSDDERKSVDLISTLSKTETKVLNFLSQGLSSKEIASRLNITLRTATNHRYNIAKKLNINGNYATMKLAFKLNKTNSL